MNRGAFLILAAMLGVVPFVTAEPAPSATLLAGNVLCVHAGQLPENFSAQLTPLLPTNPPVGIVLDLRFADGDSSAVEPAVKLLSAQKVPLAILVNSQTIGAAAELASRLRAMHAGVVIGSPDPAGIISPDVLVAVSSEDERQFQANPYAWPATNQLKRVSATNNLLAFVDHTSEADLVRKRIKDGEDPGTVATPRAEPAQPVIHDPALARAVDLLTALAVLHKSRG